MIRRTSWRKVGRIALRLILGSGLLLTVLFYLHLLSRSTSVEVMYIRYEPMLQRIFVYDCLTFLLLLYWAYLVLFLHRIRNPVIPLLIFISQAVITPYLLMGDNAVFLRFRRFVNFKAAYPMALGALSIWSAAWLFQNRRTVVGWFRDCFSKFPGI